MEMEEEETIDLHELEYSDLCSPSSSSTVDSIMEALGPSGPGLLAVTGVPNASDLRSHLLPLARSLALLPRETRKLFLKEHNVGGDVPLRNPDRSVSSFAMQLKYTKSPLVEKTVRECRGTEFENLGSCFQELGFCMMELGLCLARICDRAIGGNELEMSLLDSCGAKGRLIHYHSHLDALLLKQHERSRATSKERASNVKPLEGSELNSIARDVNPEASQRENTFPSSCFDECQSPTGHTCLQVYNPNRKRAIMVKAPPESFIIQVGEAADIISKGKLRATLHSVHRPSKFENLSRETFVVFLQPAWTKTFSISDYPLGNSSFNGFHGQCLVASDEEQRQSGQDNDNLSQEINKIVPPLSSRLKEGMTFAEFSRETTKQYYGGSGLQSNR
ncbi:uncharacterized protein LOC106771053 isoform X2 [Vigna radiata var. radiata]|uniref:Uncharacterized protein LOC106771053 isoform X2 n=1 Tax=Vigna radiata var. radiata TaxID=3916 RepID=A0A3Q0F9X3_VIGRR|nr:uncharacterized protein LOC106771053 isoform X2 [Vigna radiata var. radiata]